MASVANDDGTCSSGSSTRLNEQRDRVRGSSNNLLSYSPLHTTISRRYSLRPTPDRERRANDPIGMVLGIERRSPADQLQQIQHLQAQQGILVAELEAARALVERRQPQAPQQPVPQERPQQPQPPTQQPQPPLVTQLTQPTAAQQAPRQRRSGTKNYSNDELMSLLHCVQRVLPIGQDMWEMVARLHAIEYSHCQRDAKSIKTKYLRLANEKPSTGNPTIPEATRLAKEIKMAIDLKVGNTNPESDDFFQEGVDALSEATPSAQDAAPTVPAQIVAAPVETTVANAATATTTSKKTTRTNQVVTAMKSTSEGTMSSFSSMMEHRLQAEESELRLRGLEREAAEEQRRFDREEERRRREEVEEIRRQEREERRLEREEERRAREEERRSREEAEDRRRRDREEERNHQQQQLLTMMQVVMSGAMAFMGMKHGRDNNNNSN